MLIKNVTAVELEEALAVVNQEFDNNVIWNRGPDLVGYTRYGNRKYRLTLRVKDSRSPGARLHYSAFRDKPRRSPSACWHVHGTFFDALPTCAEIKAGKRTFHAGDRWEDWNVGSMMCPVYYSESCECGV